MADKMAQLEQDHQAREKSTDGNATGKVLMVSSVVGICLLGDSSLYALLPTFRENLGLTLAQVGFLLSMNRFVRLVTNFWAAQLYSRLGFRKLFFGVVFLAAASTATYGLTHSFTLLLVARAGWGFCWSVLRLGGYLTVLSAGNTQKSGRLMGILLSVFRMGSFCGVFFGGILADRFGFHATYYIFAALTLLGLLALPAIRGFNPARSDTGHRPQWREIIHKQTLLLNFASLVNALIVLGFIIATAGHLLKVRFGDEITVGNRVIGVATMTGFVLGGRWLFSAVLAPVAGGVIDRFGALRVALLMIGICSGGMALLAVDADLLITLLGFLMVFVSGTTVTVALPVVIGQTVQPEQRVGALAVYSTWSDLGSALGPQGYFLLGFMGIGSTYLLVAGLSVLSGLMLLNYARRKTNSVEAA